LVGQIYNYTITKDANGLSWQFTDNNIITQLPETFEGNFLIAMTHVPLEDNYYARRLTKNMSYLTQKRDNKKIECQD